MTWSKFGAGNHNTATFYHAEIQSLETCFRLILMHPDIVDVDNNENVFVGIT